MAVSVSPLAIYTASTVRVSAQFTAEFQNINSEQVAHFWRGCNRRNEKVPGRNIFKHKSVTSFEGKWKLRNVSFTVIELKT